MNRPIAFLAVAACAMCSTAYALYGVTNKGTWPESWPAELEPLRKQARTLVGPEEPHLHYAIGFTKREEFESAWPHLLKVKTKGAPVFLMRGENFFLGKDRKAGVVVHGPPHGRAESPPTEEKPIGVGFAAGQALRSRWRNTTYMELVVDGEIVDLNRIPLPADTPIIDERFMDE
jgi:hypothetical protein